MVYINQLFELCQNTQCLFCRILTCILAKTLESVQKRVTSIIYPMHRCQLNRPWLLPASRLQRKEDLPLCTDYIEKLKCLKHPLAFLLPRKELIVPNYNLRSRSNFRIFWPAEVSSSAFAGQPASKLSCLGEQSEPRENARGRDRGKESLQRSLLNFHFQPRDSAKRENCHRKRAAD